MSRFAESFGARGYFIRAADELLPTLKQALADDTVSVIACPVDYSENTRLTDKLGHLTLPGELVRGRIMQRISPLTPPLSPNPLTFFDGSRAAGPPFQSLLRVGRGVWGEGRDLRSLALLPEKILHVLRTERPHGS